MLSRNPIVKNLMIKTSDWIHAVQLQDNDLEMLRRQILNGDSLPHYVIEEDKLCKVIDGKPKICIPRDVRWRIVKMFHDDNGHPGWQRTLDAIRATYWFNDLRKFTKKFVSNCIPCMVAKKTTGKKKAKLHPIEKIAEPFHTLHVDHVGPFCKTNSGNRHILTIIDGFTKFLWLEAVPDTSSKHVCEKLEGLIKLVHAPVRIITDRGKAFDCSEFRKLCEKHQIRHIKNAVASPRSNGQVERSNRTILESLTASSGGKHDKWDDFIVEVQRGINVTINATTGIAPSELLYGFRPKLVNEIRLCDVQRKNLESLRKTAKTRCDEAGKRMKQQFDKIDRLVLKIDYRED